MISEVPSRVFSVNGKLEAMAGLMSDILKIILNRRGML
jgi:hypothetical protein